MESSHRLKGWDKEDKVNFLNALRAHGSHNIAEMHKSIPNKTREEVEEAISYFRNKASKQEAELNKKQKRKKPINQSHVPLNNWAKLLTETHPFNELRTETATALRHIADFEDIPDAVCTEKIDFRKVYHTLANALEGKTLCEDKYVAAVIDKCFTETALTSKAFMRSSTFKNAMKDIRTNESDVSPFIKPTDNNELSTLRHIIMLKNYNPLNIREENLKFSLHS